MHTNSSFEFETIFRNSLTYDCFFATSNFPVFPFHWHEDIEILHIKNGKLQITISNENILLRPGDICFIHTELTHSGLSVSDDLIYEMIQVKLNALDKIRNIYDSIDSLLNHEINVVQVFNDQEISDFFDYVSKKYKANSSNNLMLIGLICELFGLILQKHVTTQKIMLYANSRFFEVLKYLEMNHTENITIAELASKFSFETSYFSRKFKELTGATPSRYLCILRLITAAKMLTDTTLSVEIISQKCGFESANYFIRCFKERYGLSPLKYRKSHKTNK